MSYIGISDNRLKHMRAVAEKCYEIAKEKGWEEKRCRKMYLLGFVHDIGYAFSGKSDEHPDIGADMLDSLGLKDPYNSSEIVRHHGDDISTVSQSDGYPTWTDFEDSGSIDEWRILVAADLVTSSSGEYIGPLKRLYEISDRYGSRSSQYNDAVDLAASIGLIGADDYFKLKYIA